MNIVQSLRDPQIFGAAFAPLDDWAAWEVALRAAFWCVASAALLALGFRRIELR